MTEPRKSDRGRRLVSVTLFLAIVSIPLYNPSKLVSDIVTIPDVFIALFVLCVLLVVPRRIPVRFGRRSWVCVAILLTTLVSAAVNFALLGREGDFKVLLRLSEGIVFALAFAQALAAGVSSRIVRRALWTSLVAILVVACIQYILGGLTFFVFPWGPQGLENVGQDYEDFRLYSLFDNPLNMVVYLAGILGLFTVRIRDGAFSKKHLAAMAAVILIGLATASKIAAVVGIISVLALFWARDRRARWVVAAACVIAFLGALAVPAASGDLTDFYLFKRIVDPQEQQASVDARTLSYIAAGQIVLDHPLLGVGVGNYPAVYDSSYRQSSASNVSSLFTAENFFLQIAADSGLIVMALYLALAALLIVRRTGNLETSVATGAFLFLVAAEIQSSSAVPLRLFFFFFVGLSEGLRLRAAQAANPESDQFLL